MSKCSKYQNDFIPLLKSDGLPYKTCDRCKCTDKKYRDKQKEQIKVYRDLYVCQCVIGPSGFCIRAR